MAKLKGLGRGLDALLSSGAALVSNLDADSEFELKDIALDKIKPGKYQPRRNFDPVELEELSTSIKINGVIQPIVIRKVAHGYELIAGERRYRASIMAGLKSIPAVIRSFSDEEALVVSLVENIQRKDLNIIEESRGYKRLIDEFKLTHENLAHISSKSRSHITNILRLLKLHRDVQEILIDGQIDMGHARALLPLTHDLQLDLATAIIKEKLTTNEVEKRVAKLLYNEKNSNKKKSIKEGIAIQKLEAKIADFSGMKVKIEHRSHGAGRVILKYNDLDELNNFLRLL